MQPEPMEIKLLKARVESLIDEVNFLQREVTRRLELSDTWGLLGLPEPQELAYGWQLTVKGETIKHAIEESLK